MGQSLACLVTREREDYFGRFFLSLGDKMVRSLCHQTCKKALARLLRLAKLWVLKSYRQLGLRESQFERHTKVLMSRAAAGNLALFYCAGE
jgi:hypothetical protein